MAAAVTSLPSREGQITHGDRWGRHCSRWFQTQSRCLRSPRRSTVRSAMSPPEWCPRYRDPRMLTFAHHAPVQASSPSAPGISSCCTVLPACPSSRTASTLYRLQRMQLVYRLSPHCTEGTMSCLNLSSLLAACLRRAWLLSSSRHSQVIRPSRLYVASGLDLVYAVPGSAGS